MRRFIPLLVAGAAFIAAACSDSIAPTRSVEFQRFGGSVAYSWNVSSGATESAKTTTFTLDPSGGHVKVGDYTIDYAANAVCDPASSGYGPETWNLPCVTMSEPITITARFWWENKVYHAEFSPDVRFSPDAQVLISAKRKVSDNLQNYTIYYVRTEGDQRYFVNEASADADAETKYDSPNKKVWRRIKHFSGYSLSSGAPCEDTAGDPDCIVLMDLF